MEASTRPTFTAPGINGTAGMFDPDLDDETTTGPGKALTDVRDLAAAELADPVVSEPITLEVPGRPGFEVRYRTDVDAGWLAKVSQKRCRNREWPDGTDTLKLASIALAQMSQAVIRQGSEVIGQDGTPWTFRHPEMRAALGAESAAPAVARFYGRDADVIAAFNDLMEAAQREPGDNPT